MLLYKSFVILFLLFSFQICYGQRAASAQYPTNISYQDTIQKILPAKDEFTVTVRCTPESIIDSLKSDPELNYDNKVPEADDWITKAKNWINHKLVSLYSSKAYSTILDYIYYGLMIVALFLIIRGLLKADRRGLIFGKINTNSVKLTEIDEDIDKMEFDDLIASAIATGNYKLAVRYLFLKSLQLLSQKGIIELRNNKTNYQYLYEIKNQQIAEAFRDTTSKFEWIWYGNFPVDENIMKSSQNEFNNLFGLISS